MEESIASQSGRRAKVWAIVALMTSALYIGAYYAIAHTDYELGAEVYETPNHAMRLKPDYCQNFPTLNDTLRCLFHPIHLIDLKLRVTRWRA